MTSEGGDPAVKMQASASMSVQATVQHRFAKQHFLAARFFADTSACLESTLPTAVPRDDARGSHHRAYVVGAIASAVMGLEARINEIYLDACARSQTNLAELDDAAISLLSEWWPELEQRPILLKYQHALLLLGKPALPKGKNPYQDADHLIHLRSALTHYRPEWDDSLDVHADLQARLTDKFGLNPLATGSHLWFPHQCLGSGCAHWAVDTAEAFVRTFCVQLGIKERI